MSLTGLLKTGRGPVWEWFAEHFPQTQRVSTRANRALRARGTAEPCVVLLGHTDPTVTLGIYTQAMTSSDDDRERLRLLVEGGDLAADGCALPQPDPSRRAQHIDRSPLKAAQAEIDPAGASLACRPA